MISMFECSNIQDTHERLKASGVEFLDRPRSMKWGAFTQFYDPDGYVHYLKQINP